MIRVVAALACLMLIGCVESPVPLESGEKVTDPALLGIWKTDLGGDPMVATFRQEGEKLVADVQAYWEPGPKAATKRFDIVLARFGEQTYMSFTDTALKPTWSLGLYVFQDDKRFCLHSAYSQQLVGDLEKKVLPGELKPDRHMSTVELSASAEQLREYFSKHGARAFHDQPLMAFERVSSDVLPPPRTQAERDRDVPEGLKEVTPCRR